MTPELVLMLHLVVLHSVEGHEVTIAPHQVTSMRASRPGRPNELFSEDVSCVIGLTDGKFVTVIESCREVKAMLEGSRP